MSSSPPEFVRTEFSSATINIRNRTICNKHHEPSSILNCNGDVSRTSTAMDVRDTVTKHVSKHSCFCKKAIRVPQQPTTYSLSKLHVNIVRCYDAEWNSSVRF
uniref:Uncharacterized protein n=1 Tax=Caenorhabditis japonica TaxID=281687 RepID=A0A8R1EUS5_CAEJA